MTPIRTTFRWLWGVHPMLALGTIAVFVLLAFPVLPILYLWLQWEVYHAPLEGETQEPYNKREIAEKVDAFLAAYLWLQEYDTNTYEENMQLLEGLEYRP